MKQLKINLAIFCAFLASLLLSVANIIWKQISFSLTGQQQSLTLATLTLLLFGFSLMGFGFLLYVVAIRIEKISVIGPIMALSFIWIVILSEHFLQEVISLNTILGNGFIIIGVVFLVKGEIK